MKKGLKITGIIVACLLILMVVLPYAFRGKIKEVIINEGNKMLHAQFNFESLDISLFKNFPKASVTLSGFWLKGIEEFENDTLVKAGEITAAVDVLSLFGDKGYDISKISMEDTYLKAIVLENGKTNWDIMKSDSTETEEPEEKEDASFRLQLRKLSLKNINIIYDDRQNNSYTEAQTINVNCSGNFSAQQTDASVNASINTLTYKMDGVPLLSKANIAARINLEADLANNKFTLKNNEFRLNAITTALDGWIALSGNGMETDLKLQTNEIGFKEILSLIPAIYAKNFESLKTEGNVKLTAFAKGTLQGDTLPQFEASLIVKDAMFRYPALPAGVDQINIHAKVTNPGGPADLTEVDAQPFSFRLAGNPFTLTASVKTPASDPDFKIAAKGTLNLGKIKEVYPLENMELNGLVSADMSMSGRLSYIDKEQYDLFKAEGTIGLNDMILKMKDMPDINIKKSLFHFTPQYLHLSETTVNIGKNDITADCRLENYIGYILKGKTIQGNLNIQSNYFNLNDFMTAPADSTATTEPVVSDTVPMNIIEVPENINFTMNVKMKQVLFDKMQFNDLQGELKIKEKKVDMKNLSMNTMGGSVVMNGYYTTVQPEVPELNASFSIKDLSFSQTFKELDMIRQMAPVFENLKGNYSGNLQIDTKLDKEMAPILTSMQGKGNLSTKNVNLSGVKVIDQLADAVKKPDLKNIDVKDININFILKNGRLITNPFDINLKETTLSLSGSTGLDQTIDYSGKIKLPASTGIGKLISLDLKIGGTFTSPKISIDTKSMATQAIDTVKDKAIEEVGKKLGIDLSDAQKQKEALVAAAANAGDKLMEEAKKQADALIEKAGSKPLKKLAAKKAGDALIKEAEKQKQNLIREAEKQGDALIKKAQE